MQLIIQNPYRLLGVYADSSVKTRVANQARIKAFLKVGKPISFFVDLPEFLPSVKRDESAITEAINALALPEDRVKYAQFWFVNHSNVDETAFKYLGQGNVSEAKRIWRTREDAASIQNRIIIELVNKNLKEASVLAGRLYEHHVDEFLEIIGVPEYANRDKLGPQFFETLVQEDGLGQSVKNTITQAVEEAVPAGDLAEKLREKRTAELVAQLDAKIDEFKRFIDYKDHTDRECIRATDTFISESQEILRTLEINLEDRRYEYETLADRVAKCIRNASVEYFNRSDDMETAKDARRHLGVAIRIAVSENFDKDCESLDKIIQQIVPKSLENIIAQLNSLIEKHAGEVSLDRSFDLLDRLSELDREFNKLNLSDHPRLREERKSTIEFVLGHCLAVVLAMMGDPKSPIKFMRQATEQDFERYMHDASRILNIINQIKKPGEYFELYQTVQTSVISIEQARAKARSSRNNKLLFWLVVIVVMIIFANS